MSLLELIKDFSAHGKGENEFLHPQRPYIDEDGRLWVVDKKNYRIKGVKPNESSIIVEAKPLPEFVAKEGDKLVIGFYGKGVEICDLRDGSRQQYTVGRDGDVCFHNGKIYVVDDKQGNLVYQLPEVIPVMKLESRPILIASDNNKLFVTTYNYSTRKHDFFQLITNGQGAVKQIREPYESGYGIGDLVDFDFDGELFIASKSGVISAVDTESGERSQTIHIPGGLDNWILSGIAVRTVKDKKIMGLTSGSDVCYCILKE